VVMPQMGESIAEGTLSKWLKKVGDEIKRDEPIFEISTDKVDAEIPAPSGGVLAEIKVPEGKTVPVQTVVAVIETEAGAGARGPGVGVREVPAASASAPAPAAAHAPAPAVRASVPGPRTPDPGTRAPDPEPRSPAAETAEERLRRRSTPLVRRIAAEQGVDISAIPGTGHAGRVTKQDIEGYLQAGAERDAASGIRGPAAPSPEPGTRTAVPGTPWDATPWPGDRVEPMSRIRQLTAEHMSFSRKTSAHVTTFYEVDMTRVARMRAANKKAYEDRGVKLTYLGFIVKAVADQLRRHPVLNAAVQRGAIIYRGQVNIGIAVALDWGLIVPVIRGADELSLFGIAKAMADLADRARTKRLKPDEIQNGTFTITNPGVFGSFAGTPIINQPQVAILGVGAVERRPRVMTLEDGSEVVVPRTMTMLSISYDHRIVDGADADRFMSDLKKELEAFPENGV
ncbi:MAG TPA: 2-oxoglutarate dehydrogenase, E2 component, dihydrolipoamide succinyltransferase, partial [Gemmatimonadales bacterium]|nr:2-oxoglutarate dehydrogenase, E2 component, dihydrolipoamide succinyltransferase [Gemmatimonadales bacterium]